MEYIKEYTHLHGKERRQLGFKRRYKVEHPEWDDSMVLLTAAVNERLRQGARALDIGCGHGNFVLDELGDVFVEKVGYDLVPEAVSGNRSVDRVVLGDGRGLPFEAASFDLALSLWALEHVANPASLFAEVFRVLRPGGMFAFVTPNKRSLLISLRRFMSKRIADVLLERIYARKEEDVFDVYYRANSVEVIARLAESVGFSVELLKENADPSYTSFGGFSYCLSAWLSSFSFFKPHLVAILRKPL
ncbi:MAG: class I SAM-dependent methyltransferase [bacterium]|nr:class I SAM-dependent methyltransferase [bacterium]